MLCKKCNTAVEENAARCAYCGARQNRGQKPRRIAAMAAAGLLALSCGAYMYLDSAGLVPTGAEDATPPPAATEAPAQTAKPTTAPRPTATPAATSDLHMDIADVWLMLADAYNATMLYTKSFSALTPYATRGGYLYDLKANAFVTAQTLQQADMTDSQYAGAKVLLLYLRPVDLLPYGELSPGESAALTLFTAYETKDGIALLGANGARGIIYREHLLDVFARYAPRDGEITRPSSADADYEAIITAITLSSPPGGEGCIVRYMAADEANAVAVVSLPSAPTATTAYVLERTSEGFQALTLGSSPHTAVAINIAAPALNQALLPAWLLQPPPALQGPEAFAFITEYMLETETIAESDMPVTYVSGTESALYMELQSGLRFLGTYSAKGWEMLPVQGWREAEAILASLGGDPPLYIIRQE